MSDEKCLILIFILFCPNSETVVPIKDVLKLVKNIYIYDTVTIFISDSCSKDIILNGLEVPLQLTQSYDFKENNLNFIITDSYENFM